MINLTDYIIEKFKISSNNVKKIKKNVETWKELKDLIKEEYEIQNHPEVLDLNYIDISKITNIAYLFNFDDIKINNIDVSEWDVSNVIHFEGTFFNLENFNCDLSKWDVSEGKHFESMFYNCKSFTGEGLENWNISNAVDIQFMFAYNNSLNFNYEKWLNQLKYKDLIKQFISSLESCKQIKKSLLKKYKKNYL